MLALQQEDLPAYSVDDSSGHYQSEDWPRDEGLFTEAELDAKHPAGWKEQWFDVHYSHCGKSWSQEWSCACDDECPVCGDDIEARDWDDLSTLHRPNN